MSSRTHVSEESLASSALARVRVPRFVLVGGLGLGFTLRAVLDRLPRDATVLVSEFVPALVAWNHTHVAHLAGRPLDDPRVRAILRDVFDVISESTALDVILLDVDNGPTRIAHAANARLYGESGARACWAALRPSGVLALWSAAEDARYASTLERAGFEVEVKRVPSHAASGARDVLFLATKNDRSPPRHPP